jgi:hypothetical protein
MINIIIIFNINYIFFFLIIKFIKKKTFIQVTLENEQKNTNLIQGGYNPKYN